MAKVKKIKASNTHSRKGNEISRPITLKDGRKVYEPLDGGNYSREQIREAVRQTVAASS